MNDWIDAESHVEKAHQLYEDGRWDEAENELREALSLNPYRAEWHFNLGLTLEAAGRFEHAVRAFIDCQNLENEDPQVMLCLGVNLLRCDRPREALAWLEKAEKADASNPASFVHRIQAYARLGDHEQAEVMFYMAQQINPKDAQAFVNLADSLLDRALHEKAVWCLREAANLDPKMPGIHARLAEAYAATGRSERARQLYLRELRNNPGDINTLLDLGCLLVDMNRPQDAGEKFRRVLEMESDNPDAHYHLADLAERHGQVDSALEQFNVVLRLEATFPGVRRRIAALLLTRRKPKAIAEAREHLEAELADIEGKLGAGSGASRYRPMDLADLGRTLLDAGMFPEARRLLHALALRCPDDPHALHLFSVAQFQLGERAQGIETCRRVLRADPKFVPAMHNVAVAYVFEHQWSKARYWVRQALLVDPDDAALRRLRFKLRLHTVAELFGTLLSPIASVLLRRRPRTAQ